MKANQNSKSKLHSADRHRRI